MEHFYVSSPTLAACEVMKSIIDTIAIQEETFFGKGE